MDRCVLLLKFKAHHHFDCRWQAKVWHSISKWFSHATENCFETKRGSILNVLQDDIASLTVFLSQLNVLRLTVLITTLVEATIWSVLSLQAYVNLLRKELENKWVEVVMYIAAYKWRLSNSKDWNRERFEIVCDSRTTRKSHMHYIGLLPETFLI